MPFNNLIPLNTPVRVMYDVDSVAVDDLQTIDDSEPELRSSEEGPDIYFPYNLSTGATEVLVSGYLTVRTNAARLVVKNPFPDPSVPGYSGSQRLIATMPDGYKVIDMSFDTYWDSNYVYYLCVNPTNDNMRIYRTAYDFSVSARTPELVHDGNIWTQFPNDVAGSAYFTFIGVDRNIIYLVHDNPAVSLEREKRVYAFNTDMTPNSEAERTIAIEGPGYGAGAGAQGYTGSKLWYFDFSDDQMMVCYTRNSAKVINTVTGAVTNISTDLTGNDYSAAGIPFNKLYSHRIMATFNTQGTLGVASSERLANRYRVLLAEPQTVGGNLAIATSDAGLLILNESQLAVTRGGMAFTGWTLPAPLVTNGLLSPMLLLDRRSVSAASQRWRRLLNRSRPDKEAIVQVHSYEANLGPGAIPSNERTCTMTISSIPEAAYLGSEPSFVYNIYRYRLTNLTWDDEGLAAIGNFVRAG